MTSRVVIAARFMGLPVQAEIGAVGAAGRVTVSGRLMGRDGTLSLSVDDARAAIAVLEAALTDAERQGALL